MTNKLTIQDLIKILPIEEDFRSELESTYGSLSEDQKVEIGRMLWHIWYTTIDLEVEARLKLMAMDEWIGEAIPVEARNEVMKEVMNDLSRKNIKLKETSEIESLRSKLQSFT